MYLRRRPWTSRQVDISRSARTLSGSGTQVLCERGKKREGRGKSWRKRKKKWRRSKRVVLMQDGKRKECLVNGRDNKKIVMLQDSVRMGYMSKKQIGAA